MESDAAERRDPLSGAVWLAAADSLAIKPTLQFPYGGFGLSNS